MANLNLEILTCEILPRLKLIGDIDLIYQKVIALSLIKIPHEIMERIIQEVSFTLFQDDSSASLCSISLKEPINKIALVKLNLSVIQKRQHNFQTLQNCLVHEYAHYILNHDMKQYDQFQMEKDACLLAESWGIPQHHSYKYFESTGQQYYSKPEPKKAIILEVSQNAYNRISKIGFEKMEKIISEVL